MLRRPSFLISLAYLALLLLWQPANSVPWSFQKHDVRTRNTGRTSASSPAFPVTELKIIVNGAADIHEEKPEEPSRLPKLSNKTLFMISLLGLSGILEAICFRRFKVFPNMMTGNTVRCIDALAELRFADIQLYGGMIASYISGGALFKFMDEARIFPKTPNLVWLSRVSLGIFCASDLVGLYKDRMRMIPLAVACGMINTATQEAIGAVTNAVTGHIGKIGVGLGKAMAMQLRPQTSADPAVPSTNKAFISSLQGLSAFVTALLSTTLIWQWLEAKHPWILSRLPPLGVSLGAVYTALLSWYSRATEEKTTSFIEIPNKPERRIASS
jgi:uncharacterized membrane protein YoaK (UPF0700 family)